MAYNKLKQEQYTNVGGINTKASVYITNEREVLDLVNYDLQTIGAWSQRMGMTNAIAGNTLAVGASNRFNFGWQTYQVYTRFGVGVSFSQQTYIQSNSGTYSLSLTNGVLTIPPGGTLTGSEGFGNAVNVVALRDQFASETFADNIGYFSSGFKTFKSNQSNIYYYGLPYVGDSAQTALSYGTTGTGSYSGVYLFYTGYRDLFKYDGVITAATQSNVGSGQFALYISGATFSTISLSSGATSVVVYANRVNGFGTSEIISIGAMSLSTTLTISVTNGLLIPNSGFGVAAPNQLPNYEATAPVGSKPFYTAEAVAVEQYSLRLFWAVAKGQNILFYSNPIEYQNDAQGVEADAFLNLPSNNYPIIGIKNYNQSLICFFQKGVGRLTGNNENNFNYQELSTEYGLVSSRAVVEFKERLWFLDQYQIMEFSGSNFSDVSNKVQGYLQRMNVDAAQKTATAYHYEDRNEVWFAIPIDGSNENNIVLVFDYEIGSWYAVKSTSNFTNLTRYFDQTVQQGLSLSTVYMNNPRFSTGHPGGSLGYFGASFKTDYGNAFTLSFKTRYHAEQGHSVTSEWRRFYLDTGPWQSVTLSFNTNFYANFATATISLTRTIFESGLPYSGPQQTRIDFGIPAKSLSVETHIATGASIPIIRVYGYTIEHRFLRNV